MRGRANVRPRTKDASNTKATGKSKAAEKSAVEGIRKAELFETGQLRNSIRRWILAKPQATQMSRGMMESKATPHLLHVNSIERPLREYPCSAWLCDTFRYLFARDTWYKHLHNSGPVLVSWSTPPTCSRRILLALLCPCTVKSLYWFAQQSPPRLDATR